MENKKERFELVEIPTQTTLMFKDNSTNEVLDVNQYLLRLDNELNDIMLN